MDRIAGNAMPLLLNYDPGLPLDAFCPLLLGRKEDMTRLKDLEGYLFRRQEGAPKPYFSAFGEFGSVESFAVQYYRISTEHQSLRQKIETWGLTMKAQKLQEYNKLKARHDSLDSA